jgi:hypothetical protein
MQGVATLAASMWIVRGLSEEGIASVESRSWIDGCEELLHRPLVAGVNKGHPARRHANRNVVIVQIVGQCVDSADPVGWVDLLRGPSESVQLREGLSLVLLEVLHGGLDQGAGEHNLGAVRAKEVWIKLRDSYGEAPSISADEGDSLPRAASH